MTDEPPADIISKISSKHNLKYSFIDKLSILSEWVGDSEIRRNHVGVFVYQDKYICINTSVLKRFIPIKERSMHKNLQIKGFIRKTKLNDWDVYCRININIEKEDMIIKYWEDFSNKYMQRSLNDLVNFLPNINKIFGFISIFQILYLIYKVENVDSSVFSSIYKHFGPFEYINQKIALIAESLFSRGWFFGDGKNTIFISSENCFIFNDGNIKKLLYNNYTDNISVNDIWLVDEEGKYVDLEYFMLKYYPNSIKSDENFVYIVRRYFS